MDDHIMKAVETLAKGAEDIRQAFETVSEQGLPNGPGIYTKTSGSGWEKLKPADTHEAREAVKAAVSDDKEEFSEAALRIASDLTLPPPVIKNGTKIAYTLRYKNGTRKKYYFLALFRQGHWYTTEQHATRYTHDELMAKLRREEIVSLDILEPGEKIII